MMPQAVEERGTINESSGNNQEAMWRKNGLIHTLNHNPKINPKWARNLSYRYKHIVMKWHSNIIYLTTEATYWQQPKHLPTGDWLSTLIYIYKMESYSSV